MIRATPQIRELLDNLSLASGLPISEIVRRKIIGSKIPDQTKMKTLHELRVIRNLLLKHGGLFKHLYNMNPTYKEETAAALKEEIKMYGNINTLIQHVSTEIYGKKESAAARTRGIQP